VPIVKKYKHLLQPQQQQQQQQAAEPATAIASYMQAGLKHTNRSFWGQETAHLVISMTR